MSSILTVGIAVYAEFDSVYFTIQGLRANHGNNFDIVVIDNAPESCKRTQSVTLAAGGRYYHRPDLNGTSRPRDACFQFSTSPWTLVVDSHVLFENDAIELAIKYCKEHPDSKDIIAGPMIADDGRGVSTHWRTDVDAPNGLWGVWDSDPRGRNKYDEPFEIPMMGLGCFMMRKEAWPHFHHLFRGFGGEEGYIHEKVRKLGGKAICLPSLRWRHKFRDISSWSENPIPYPIGDSDHVRNLVIGHRELGVEGYEELIRDKFGKKIDTTLYTKITEEAREKVPFNEIITPKKQRILGLWYTHNKAPDKMLQASLSSIHTAKSYCSHNVDIVTVGWKPVIPNSFPFIQYKDTVPGGSINIVRQCKLGINTYLENNETPDIICFLEHDVLYAPGYFQRIGDEFSRNPTANVVSHLDYVGLNSTGWLAVKERHEPMHQLSIRYNYAINNLNRAEKALLTEGEAEVEPDPSHEKVNGNWVSNIGNGNRKTPQYAEVESNLWIGERVDILPPGVTAVLSVMGLDDGSQPDVYRDSPSIDYLSQPISDDQAKPAPSMDWLEKQVTWVTDEIKNNKSVYIHCLGGVSRSGLVTTAYIMKSHNVGRDIALNFIRQARPQVSPRPAFWQLLLDYEKILGSNLSTSITKKSWRSTWVRIQPDNFAPSVHINHLDGRNTSHGEVVFEKTSSYGSKHPYWGEHKHYWPHEGLIMADDKNPGSCGCGGSGSSTNKYDALQTWYLAFRGTPSDFHEHMDALRDYAAKCQSVTQIGAWGKPSRISLAFGTPGTYTDYAPRVQPEWSELQRHMGERFKGKEIPVGQFIIEPTDLLFIDTNHTESETYRLLSVHSPNVNKYLAVHTTQIYGEKGDDGGPGVLVGIRKFISENPEWSVIYDNPNNNGMMILSKLQEDKKELPSTTNMVWKYLKSKTKHWLSGGEYLPLPMAEERLKHCWICPARVNTRCSKCGCYLDVIDPEGNDPLVPVKVKGDPGKVFHPQEFCPIGKWNKIDPKDIVKEVEDNE